MPPCHKRGNHIHDLTVAEFYSMPFRMSMRSLGSVSRSIDREGEALNLVQKRQHIALELLARRRMAHARVQDEPRVGDAGRCFSEQGR